jgi:hypothetical protein
VSYQLRVGLVFAGRTVRHWHYKQIFPTQRASKRQIRCADPYMKTPTEPPFTNCFLNHRDDLLQAIRTWENMSISYFGCFVFFGKVALIGSPYP